MGDTWYELVRLQKALCAYVRGGAVASSFFTRNERAALRLFDEFTLGSMIKVGCAVCACVRVCAARVCVPVCG